MKRFRPEQNRSSHSRRRSKRSFGKSSSTSGERLQKVLAAAGLASRRDCEELILQGRVEVDGQVVSELGTRVTPEQTIRVDGATLARTRREYYIVNKPVNVLCTNFDPSGRTRVIDLLPSQERLFTVGRLDRSSEGLILVTNDGELAHHLMHPRFEVEKTYIARVAGLPSKEVLDKLRRGIHLAEGFAKVATLVVRKRHRLCTDLEIVLKEGKNREIRRILARVGHKVLRLKRTAFGPIRLADLPIGAYRRLTSDELNQLRLASQRPKPTRHSKEESGGPPTSARRAIQGRPSQENYDVSIETRRTSEGFSQSPTPKPVAPEYVAPAHVPDASELENLSDWEADLFQEDEFSSGFVAGPDDIEDQSQMDEAQEDDELNDRKIKNERGDEPDEPWAAPSTMHEGGGHEGVGYLGGGQVRGGTSFRGTVIGDEPSSRGHRSPENRQRNRRGRTNVQSGQASRPKREHRRPNPSGQNHPAQERLSENRTSKSRPPKNRPPKNRPPKSSPGAKRRGQKRRDR